MAKSYQPPNGILRIDEVIDPGDGHYVVVVALDNVLAANFPDEPFGLLIDEIGLPSSLIEKYTGYQLTKITKPEKYASSVLNWYFQRLPGPEMAGSQGYAEGVRTVTTKQEVAPGTPAGTGLMVIESSVTPDGLGISVLQQVVASGDEWPVLKGSEWNDELQTQVIASHQHVAPPTDFTEENTSFHIVNQDRSLKVQTSIPEEYFLNYRRSFPSTTDLQLPHVLKSIELTWTTSNGFGSSDWSWSWYGTEPYSVGISIPYSSSSSCSVHGTITPIIEMVLGNNIPSTMEFFYVPVDAGTYVISRERLLAKIQTLYPDALMWPVFHPVSHSINVQDMKTGVRGSGGFSFTRKSSDDQSSGDDTNHSSLESDSSVSNNITVISPTIHEAIGITNSYASAHSITSIIGNEPSGPSNLNHGGSATGCAYPTFFPATKPDRIPSSGYYITRVVFDVPKYGFARCTATIIDAADI